MEIGCMVCEMPFDERDRDECVAASPCGHVFHKTCLEARCTAFAACPTCEFPLSDPPIVTKVILNDVQEGMGETLSELHADRMHLQQENELLLAEQKRFKEKIQTLEKKLAENEKRFPEKNKVADGGDDE